jgi:hypothetical protein
MVLSDITNRENGLIQRCEDFCGLGATGITANAALFSMFVGWLNQWHKTGISLRIMSGNGSDADDPNYTTLPSGTITGTTNRDYNMGSSYVMLKFKNVNVSYDGVNVVPATPIDSNDQRDLAFSDPNIDSEFSTDSPQYDELANGFKLYPKFTAAQVAAGAFVEVEFYRAPRTYATSGTDSYGVALDLQFHHFPAVGASFEYCKIYKPDLAKQLQIDLYGNNANIKGLVKEFQEWENAKQPSNTRITMNNLVKR